MDAGALGRGTQGPAVTAPLVLTLRLDVDTQGRFDALRREHFPPDRNHLDAHVTLFHAVPGRFLSRVLADADDLAPPSPLPLLVTGVRFLGRGVAYDLDCPGAAHLRAELARRWVDLLTPQDRQRWRPHVTVQNKVSPETARELSATLARAFAPTPATATGLAVWRYLGGPWEAVAEVPFATRGPSAE